MNNQEYEQKKRECWENFLQKHGISRADGITADAFIMAFDRAYALGREKETITQEEIEKAAIEYVLTRQQARHNAKKEEDATMRDFDKTIKAWDAYDMEQAFESGANLFLGKQEKDTEDTVISGWVARNSNGNLLLFRYKPERKYYRRREGGLWMAGSMTDLNSNLFPNLTWDNEPQEVEIQIKRKKNV